MRNVGAKICLILLCLLLAGACSRHELQRFHKQEWLMGTEVAITLFHDDADAAGGALAAAFEEVARIEGLMSTYMATSEIGRLNDQGKVEAGTDTLFVLERALHYTHITNGAFDVSVKPVLDLYRDAFAETGKPPNREALEQALALVGAGRILIDGRRVILPERARITLGGIAKGYAIDRAVEVLQARGIRHALVNAGGDMRALGDKNGAPWRIALQNPRDRNDCLAVLPLNNCAVATSGDYERYFEPTKQYHHILDPRTGASADTLISVTIVTAEALDADALATSVFVLGPEEGLTFVESLAGVEALLIAKDRRIIYSTGLRME